METFIFENCSWHHFYYVGIILQTPTNVKLKIEEEFEGDYETKCIEYEGDNNEEKFNYLEKQIYFPKNFDFPDAFPVTWLVSHQQ